MLCARQQKKPDTLLKGSDGTAMCVYVSAESHYSVLMSANVIGLGYENCVKVGTNIDGEMCMEALEAAV